ncbi:beta-galactosidase GalA [Paenibacillus sp. FSL H3-0333]|uniref:beta-galactosidase GalA n=1 Tax=Paenibacillus sp. FSL H3-0333 TaxID=2921373 RepID=UPI0030F8AC95
MRERLSMDKDWLFHHGDIAIPVENSHKAVYGNAKAGGIMGAASIEWNDNEWETVGLPHDWSYRQPFDREGGVPDFGYKPRGIGWYRKKFKLEPSDNGRQLLLEFDGIATYATIYLNGSVLGRNFCGYTSFVVDITDNVFYGDRPNLLVVKVDASVSEGWWYEGAGIYRHVWLTKKDPLSIADRGIWVNPVKQDGGQWLTNVETRITNERETAAEVELLSRVVRADGAVVAEERTVGRVEAGEAAVLKQELPVSSPLLWDVEAPHLYKLHSTLLVDGEERDTVTTSYGYRSIRICPNTGFYLNERPLKIKGTCNHQDHAGVGVALPDSLHEYRIQRLKEMGSNAYRCAHHNPAPELLEACDRLGMLVMDENRNFDSSPEGLRQVGNMVTRDRNHPSVVFYSLFNEEPLQGTPVGRKMFKRMKQAILRLDDTRPVLGAMNGGVMEDGGTVDVMDIAGFNYMHGGYDRFHEKHPGQPMIGSETVSAFATRGTYVSDTALQFFDSFDRERANWGNTARESWQAINTRDYMMGTFVWTGFDYRGEPTPYEWPSVSTHFGILDTCGFPKDSYYLYQAFWLDEPVAHITGGWNWPGKEGQPVTVMTHTNCDEVELYVNGELRYRQAVELYEQCQWEIPYEPGTLRLEGYRQGKRVAVDEKITPGAACALRVETSKPALLGDGRDAVVVNVYAIDAEGRFVETAGQRVAFSLTGSGIILGAGNGNPNSHEPDHLMERCLFNGCLQLIVGSVGSDAGHTAIELTLQGEGLQPLVQVIPVEAVDEPPYVLSVHERYINNWLLTQELSPERPDPNVEIHPTDMNSWEKVDVSFGPQQLLQGADGYVIYRSSIALTEREKSSSPYLYFHALSGDTEIYVNGRLLAKQTSPWPSTLEVALDDVELGDETVLSVLVGIQPDVYKPGINGAVSMGLRG